jgi:4-alpha-glucanotransferase
MNLRASGILMPISCLPGPYGIGEVGPDAYTFVDFLCKARQSYWQIIPLTPPHPRHYSPYHSPSAFAGNGLLLSPELLAQDGLISRNALSDAPKLTEHEVDFPEVMRYKPVILRKAFETFSNKASDYEYEIFCDRNQDWLDDYTLFTALKEHFQDKPWNEWPAELRDRNKTALEEATQRFADRVALEKFIQYAFFKHWYRLKAYCNEHGVQVIGDLPIYVDFNSADVWANPRYFKLDAHKKPYVVAGVPPDYFSATGQLWGHPLYDWNALRQDGYSWWLDRIGHNLTACDMVRIDHFRGIVGYWEVPATETTALNGKWMDGPSHDFFKAVLRRFPNLPIIAEDLGVITPDVREVMNDFGFPGMKLLMFAFGEDIAHNPYAPHNIPKNSIVFTGTHDNNTVRGWFDHEAPEADKQRLFAYLGREVPADEIHWEMVRMAMMSVAQTAIIPTQDLLGLDGDARMNLPSEKYGNWKWRLKSGLLTDDLAVRLARMTELYGRC